MSFKFEGTEYKRGELYLMLPEDITLDPNANGRHEAPDIEYLIEDILKRGQHTPVIIRKDGGKATLVAGFSRWRAITEINKRGLTTEPLRIRATHQHCTASEAFLINVSENRFRNQVTPLDDAHNIKRLLNVYGMDEREIAAFYFPTAKTDDELKEANSFVRERIALLTLTPEAEKAVRSGRVKPNAATAIAKLSEEQQRNVLASGKQTIKRSDVTPPKPIRSAKGVVKDPHLVRLAWAALEDVAGILGPDNQNEYVDVDRIALFNLCEYVKEQRGAAA